MSISQPFTKKKQTGYTLCMPLKVERSLVKDVFVTQWISH